MNSMFGVNTIFNLVFVSSCLLSQRGSCKNFDGNSKSNKVTGGHSVTSLDQFPFVVSIQVLTETGYIHGCSGTICGSKHIITAAHCLHGRTAEMLLMLVGTVELNEKEVHPYRGQFYRVKKIVIHEKYDPPKNDIAIIEIWGEMNFHCNANAVEESLPARIAMSLTETKDGTVCYAMGWGFVQTPYDHEHPRIPNTLRWAELPIFNHTKCVENYNENGDSGNLYVGHGTICAGYDAGGIATCFGDSGSGLVCNGKLVGIVSFGPRVCGEPRKPGVFTEVFQYLTWISKHGCTLCGN